MPVLAQWERDFLGEVSRTLASSLDYETTLVSVARLAVSEIADWCGVDLLEGGTVRRMAVAHADPAKEEIAAALRRYPFDPDAPGGTPEAIRTGRSALYASIPDGLLERVASDPEQRRLLRELGMRSALVVPLIAHGETLGAIALVRAAAERAYGPRDLMLAEELALRAATAVDHARLFRQTQDARDALENLTTEMDLQLEELHNQAVQLEESQAELEMANDDLAASEARYRRLVETSPHGVFVLSAAGVFTEVNAAGARILGAPAAEVLGGHFTGWIDPGDRTRAADAFARVISGGEGTREVDLRVVRPSGETRLVNVVITGIREHGTVTGVHGVSRDVTEERRTREALRESEESYRMLFDSLTELVYVQDLAGRFVSVNEAVVRRYGYARAELLGRSHDVLIDTERTDLGEAGERFLRAAAGEPQQFEIWGRTRDGEVFPKALTLARGRYFGQDVVIAVARDVTERKQAEAARRESERREQMIRTAEAANRAKSEFLSRMSHELRTPLNAILGFGQLLELDVETAENRESAEQIVKAGKHLLALIDEVLDIARIEAGQMSLSVEPVPVGVVLRESVDLVRLVAAKRGVALRADEAVEAEHFVRADQQRLKQVMLNLLSNAIKYNRPDGSVTLSCELAEGDRLRVVVVDTGFGIPAGKRDRLFTPFDRLGADQTPVEGTGLGLALSKRLVEAMGGTLGLESNEGEGSRFWVELPLVPSPTPGGASMETRREEPAGKGTETTHTVLFVEDNPANLRLMERLFQRRPHVRLLTAIQGRIGLELAREHAPDLILLDLNLPDLSGDQLLLRLRRDPALREVPVVMVSGDAIPSQVQRMLDLGAQGYLTKPFDIRELLGVVDEMLSRSTDR
jgi:PAS domain S-box-containing protein